ncbi:uncharacterized protein LOC144350673 [Saccoglossus kowalevskii]
MQQFPYRTSVMFREVKKKLEYDHPHSSTVFFKEFAYFLMSHLDCLPDNFKHSFLIRKPSKAIRSQYIARMRCVDESMSFRPEEVGFRELWQLYSYVKDTLGQNPVVIDADDLLDNPKAIMKGYCNKMNLKYQDSMVHWDEGKLVNGMSIPNMEAWYSTVRGSSGFVSSYHDPSDDDVRLPDIVVHSIHDSEPYYQQLYHYRIRGNDTSDL